MYRFLIEAQACIWTYTVCSSCISMKKVNSFLPECHFHSQSHVFRPDTGSQSIAGIVGKCYGFLWSAEGQHCQHRTKYLSQQKQQNGFWFQHHIYKQGIAKLDFIPKGLYILTSCAYHVTGSAHMGLQPVPACIRISSSTWTC